MSKAVAFILFFLIANPMMYDLTSNLPLVGSMIEDKSGRPTQVGVLIHALVFVILSHFVWQMMKK
jgi:hypothetical protein